MWLAYLLLFIALSPGVLFTIPALGKKMGGKVIIAAMHAVLFVIVVQLLRVSEGFQATSGSIMNYDTPTRFVCRINPTTTARSRATAAARAALEASLSPQLQSYTDAKNASERAVSEYENIYHEDMNKQQETLEGALDAKQNEINSSDPTVAPLYTTLQDAGRRRDKAAIDALRYKKEYSDAIRSGNRGRISAVMPLQKAANDNIKQANLALGVAYSAYNAANDLLMNQLRASTESQIATLNSDARFQEYRRNRQDLYDAYESAKTAYNNKRAALLRDPVNTDLAKAVALAIYNHKRSCQGINTVATSIPFMYSIFGLVF